MNGSIQIARFFGIPVLLHWSFGLLFLYVFYIGNKHGLQPYQMIWLSLFVAALFVCIVMHEFGHALTARRYGVKTRDIILLPIGGVARLNKLPEKPIQEFVVAIAGPLVNIGLALLLSGYYLFFRFPSLVEREIGGETDLIGDYQFFLPSLIFLNVMLAVFNLLPVFPMDGGRILRALLATKLGRQKATRIAVLLGQAIAILMFFYGIMEYSFTTVLIGVFIFFTASQEYKWVKRESILSAYNVGHVYRNDYSRLGLGDSVARAYDLMLRNAERNFLIFDEMGQLSGSLPEWSIFYAKRNNMLDKTIGEFYTPNLVLANADDNLKAAAEILQQTGAGIIVVMEGQEILGVVDNSTLENVLTLNSA